MYESQYDVYKERGKDLHREAENKRLADSVRKPNSLVRRARQSLGRGLVNVGHNLLKD